jgi:GDP-4-dehydro-6-deoxy-D-mannose reductase
MRALITGATGFVGRHLIDHLKSNYGDHAVILGTTSNKEKIREGVVFSDLTDEHSILDLIDDFKPDQIYHLAAVSNVKESWENKAQVFHVNVLLAINLLEAARKSLVKDTVKILTVGSSEEYGSFSDRPIDESARLKPSSPYGISKASLSMLAALYFRAYGLNVVHVRAFNHAGPGQGRGFVIPDFAYQIARIESGVQEPVIRVGNLEARRDFTDVRDIVRAYCCLLNMKNTAFGEVYNVCSGTATSIRSILDQLIELSNSKIEVFEDPVLFRPIDEPIRVGDNRKIRDHLGWTPSIPLKKTLADVLEEMRKNVQDG